MVFRLFGLVSIVASLAAVGYLYSAQSQQVGPTSARSAQAAEVGAAFVLQQSAAAMETAHQTTGMYAGADLRAFDGVLLVRADQASYCLQIAFGTAVFHQAGPNGTSAPGPC